MSSNLARTVWLDPTLNHLAGQSTLSSLPQSLLQTTDRFSAAFVVLNGQRRNWTELYPPSATTSTIVVDPQLGSLPSRMQPFVLDSPWAANPGCSTFAGQLQTADWQFGECCTIAPLSEDPKQVLFRAASLLRACGLPLSSIEVLFGSATGLAAQAQSGDHPVRISISLTAAALHQMSVRAFTATGAITGEFDDPDLSQPARISITDRSGTLLLPTIWETGHRAAWKRALTDASANDAPGSFKDQQLITEAFTRKETP